MIILGAVYEEHHIGILLDGSRLTKVGQLRTLTLQTLTVLNRTVKLRESEDRNVKLFGETLQRLRNLRHLLLTATEAHTVSVHKLEVVDHDNLHALLAHKTACLGAQLEDREARRIVDVERRALQIAHILVKAFPFVVGELTIKHLVARNLADVRDKTVYKLHVVHLKREESDRRMIVDSYVLSERKGERSLAHGRTSGDDDKVGTLPTTRLLVEFLEARRHTRQAAGVGRRFLKDVNGAGDDGVYLRVVLLHVALRELEERAFRLLHQFVYVLRLVERLCLNDAGIRDELSGEELLCENLGVILDVSRRSHVRAEVDNVRRTAHVVDSALTFQLVYYGHDVDRVLVHRERLYGVVYLLVARFVECLGAQCLGHDRERILIDHKRTKHHLLYVNGLRLQMAIVLVESLWRSFRRAFCSRIIWHE